MGRVSEINVFLALLAAGLLGLGVPRTIDSVMQFQAAADQDLSNIDNLQNPAAQVAHAAQLESVDDWFHDPDASIRAGTIQFLMAVGQGNVDAARVETAIGDLETGLARAPADPKAWMMLALARNQLNDIDGARLALRSSILIAPYDPTLLLPRAGLGLKLVSALQADDWQLVSEQIRMAADHQFDGLVKLAEASDDPTPIMTALASDPDRAAALLAALGQNQKK